MLRNNSKGEHHERWASRHKIICRYKLYALEGYMNSVVIEKAVILFLRSINGNDRNEALGHAEETNFRFLCKYKRRMQCSIDGYVRFQHALSHTHSLLHSPYTNMLENVIAQNREEKLETHLNPTLLSSPFPLWCPLVLRLEDQNMLFRLFALRGTVSDDFITIFWEILS